MMKLFVGGCKTGRSGCAYSEVSGGNTIGVEDKFDLIDDDGLV